METELTEKGFLRISNNLQEQYDRLTEVKKTIEQTQASITGLIGLLASRTKWDA